MSNQNFNNSNLSIKTKSTEDKMCICSRYEIKGMCNYVNESQRLGREQGGLGLCHKLNVFTFYDFVESHLEKYKLIVDTRREKRNYIEVELLPILQKFDSNIVATSYKIYYHEEFLDIRYTNKNVRLYITATNLEGIKNLVRKKILKPKILEIFKMFEDDSISMQNSQYDKIIELLNIYKVF